MAKIRLVVVSMTDSFDKLVNICLENNLDAETVDHFIDIKKALEEKEKLEQALDKACCVIADLNDCTNYRSVDYPTCPFKYECWKLDGCIGDKEKWKKYFMGL